MEARLAEVRRIARRIASSALLAFADEANVSQISAILVLGARPYCCEHSAVPDSECFIDSQVSA